MRRRGPARLNGSDGLGIHFSVSTCADDIGPTVALKPEVAGRVPYRFKAIRQIDNTNTKALASANNLFQNAARCSASADIKCWSIEIYTAGVANTDYHSTCPARRNHDFNSALNLARV